MLKTLTSVNEYLDFINEINSDPNRQAKKRNPLRPMCRLH